MPGLSYESAGVNYDSLDAFKRACQRAAATTTSALASHGLKSPPTSAGNRHTSLRPITVTWPHVEEGLGTKNLVADAITS